MVIFDSETNGFLADVTRAHCLVTKDIETGEKLRYYHKPQHPKDQPIEAALEYLQKIQRKGRKVVAHNGIKYDVPVLEKLYPGWTLDEEHFLDTLVLSRLIYSDIGTRDSLLIAKNRKAITEDVLVGTRTIGRGKKQREEEVYETRIITPEYTRFPSKLWGSHSLKAWGWRLQVYKGTYAEETEDAWSEFSWEMLDYCEQDVEVTHALLERLLSKNYSQRAIELEHQIAWICARMERSGWPFREEKAAELYAKLTAERETIRQQMLQTFKPIVIDRGLGKNGKPLKPKVIEFNPGSRKQIAERLQTKYGWKPQEYTPSGEAKVDEDVLKKLAYPEAQMLAHYFLLEKRIGQLSEGDQGWLKCVRNGHIHGSINTNGAVTGRCTHAAPNIAQVPSVRALWGPECRSLFTVRPGFRMVGADLSGLELRCLAHFMSKWDGGEYADTVLNGDVHTKNQVAAGLPTRDNAKTFIYAFLYGAGDEKIGSIVGKGRAHGKKLKERFLEQTPALKKLREAVVKACTKGHLIGLDGRLLAVRSDHAALNTLLQSAGALISKRWVIECFLEAERRGLRYGWDGDFTMLGYIHDEIQWAVREGLEEEFGQMVVECAARAGEFFNFKCPIGAEFKVGNDWHDTH